MSLVLVKLWTKSNLLLGWRRWVEDEAEREGLAMLLPEERNEEEEDATGKIICDVGGVKIMRFGCTLGG